MADIFARIRDAVQGTPTSDEIRAVIRETKDALADRQAWRKEFEATAANPLVDTSEAHRAQDQIVRSHLDERRLAEGLRLLEARSVETVEAERQAHLTELYDAARAKRDEFVVRFRKAYPKAARAIVDLLEEMRDLDGVLAGIAAPAGQETLDRVSTVLSADPKQGILDASLPMVTLCDAPTWNTLRDREQEQRDQQVAQNMAMMAAFAPSPRPAAARAI